MANIKSIGGNPIVLDASGIAAGAVTPDKLADMGGITAGAADALTGGGGTAASWLERTSSADGVVTIRSIHGNTVVEDGALVPVNMTGIATTGFNQWDEEWEKGYISDTTGENAGTGATYLRSKNHILVFPSTEYHFTRVGVTGNAGKVYYYDAAKAFISWENVTFGGLNKTTPANARYMRFWLNYTGDYHNDICINISDPTRNGEYESYWSSQREIAASTYFPNGMRSAGTVRDELTSTEAITRVGVVDLGTLTWYKSDDLGGAPVYYANLSDIAVATSNNVVSVSCAALTGVSADYLYEHSSEMNLISLNEQKRLWVRHAAVDTASFKTAMSGVMLYYALATPTVTPIDPPLNLSYRVDDFGTERIMVPEDERSAPPTIVAAQGYTAESLRDAALATIAPVENGLASTNYAVGSYLVHGGQLCKVTTAIATGEAITIGTNVTTTTVMAEVIALIAQ